MNPISVTFSGRTWRGFAEGGVLRFDFSTNEGKDIRFFVLPDKCVILARRPWPDTIAPYTEWLVHLVDARRCGDNPAAWEIIDREIELIVERDCQTYRMIDLDDFGDAVAAGNISAPDGQRLLKVAQVFIDEYLHGGGRFPPEEVRPWLDERPNPQPLPDTSA